MADNYATSYQLLELCMYLFKMLNYFCVCLLSDFGGSLHGSYNVIVLCRSHLSVCARKSS